MKPRAGGAAAVFIVAVLAGATGAAAAPGAAASPAAASPAAASPVVSPSADPVADCSLVSAGDAARLLGYDVLPVDVTARATGTCYFPSQAVSQSGTVAYTILTTARLAQLRPYFTLYARRCGTAAAASAQFPDCMAAAKLARVTDLETYFAIRTGAPGAQPLAGLGTAAFAAGDTLYVRRGALLFEAAVRRDDAFDLERSERLARLILERSAP